MTKKLLELILFIAALIIVMLIFYSVTQPAYAAEYAKGTEENPAKAAITKVIKTPIGTTLPAATFTFEFKPILVDSIYAADTDMPEIPDRYVSFDGSERLVVNGDDVEVYRESEDILKGIVWPHAGVYKYKLTEAAPPVIAPEDPSYDQCFTRVWTPYYLDIYVDNKADGSGTYVKFITAIRECDIDGYSLPENEVFKVDPTPGNPSITGDYSDMIFTNIFVRWKAGEDPLDPNQNSLEISKTVAGLMAEKDKYFGFDITLHMGGLGMIPSLRTAYVIENIGGTDKVVTSEKNGKVIGSDEYGSFLWLNGGDTETVNLKHGQRLVISYLNVGMPFTVTERPAEDYTAGYSLISGGKDPLSKSNSEDNTQLSTDRQYIGEGFNGAAFTNTYKAITPTGIAVDDMPYLIIIGVALALLTGFLFYRYSRKKEEREDDA